MRLFVVAPGEPLVLASVLDDELVETLLVMDRSGSAFQSLLGPKGLFHISSLKLWSTSKQNSDCIFTGTVDKFSWGRLVLPISDVSP